VVALACIEHIIQLPALEEIYTFISIWCYKSITLLENSFLLFSCSPNWNMKCTIRKPGDYTCGSYLGTLHKAFYEVGRYRGHHCFINVLCKLLHSLESSLIWSWLTGTLILVLGIFFLQSQLLHLLL
jgi:hypothetical protein